MREKHLTKEIIISELKEINSNMLNSIGMFIDKNGYVDSLNYNDDLDDCLVAWLECHTRIEDFIEEITKEKTNF